MRLAVVPSAAVAPDDPDDAGTYCIIIEAYFPGANNALTAPIGYFQDMCGGGERPQRVEHVVSAGDRELHGHAADAGPGVGGGHRRDDAAHRLRRPTSRSVASSFTWSPSFSGCEVSHTPTFEPAPLYQNSQ